MLVLLQRLRMSLLVGLVAGCGAVAVTDAAGRGPRAAAGRQEAASPEEEQRTMMKAGRWEGEYVDVDGHHAKLRFTIAGSGDSLKGDFELVLATEDKPEKYQGSVTASVDADQVILRLQADRGGPLVCTLTLREPAAYAEQAAFGVVAPAPTLKLGGGVLIVWKFRG